MTLRDLCKQARTLYPNKKLRHKWIRTRLKYPGLVPKCPMAVLFNTEQLAPRERVWR